MERLTNKNYQEKIAQGIVLVDFSAKWCGPCQMLAPVLEELAAEMQDVAFYQVDIDHERKLALAHDVMSIPTLILYRDGQKLSETRGFSPKAMIQSFIERAY